MTPPTSPCPWCGHDTDSFDETYSGKRGWSCLYRCCGHVWGAHHPPRRPTTEEQNR